MSKNLEAIIRYRVINNCLRNKFKKFPTKDELIEACENEIGTSISERTIDKDLFEMRTNESLGFLAPIRFDKKNKGYCYTNPNYSIDSIPIGQSDLNAIQFASVILGQYSNVEILNDFKGAVNKIIDTVKVQRILHNEPSLKGLVQLDKMDNIAGNEHLNILIECIKSRNLVLLRYKKFGSIEEKKYQFEPYVLKEFDSLWYVTGKISEGNEFRTFALDRIIAVEMTQTFFKIDTAFDREIYYHNVFGVSHTEHLPTKIVIRVEENLARFLTARKIHSSQKLENNDENFTIFSFELVLNPEIESKLMSFGEKCEVLEPEILRDKIKEKFKKALKKYS
jgi:predicted DNA-binding transcriptional regulator YafY